MSRAHDIKQALLDHAHVAECTVAPLIDLYGRETVTAFVVMRDDEGDQEPSPVWDHLRKVLPGDHQPDAVHVVDELPTDPEVEARARQDDSPA